MCGITGIISYDRNDNIQSVNEMNDVLQHRGPDGMGIYSDDFGNQNITLGHRRLSIIDLSKRGSQPMEIGDWVITFNGEIYNYIELRSILEGEGIEFYSDSDTEVLLRLFIKHGEKSLELLEGMFAFAIYNKQNGQVFIARDRFGEKPFYYLQENNKFIFASELKAIKQIHKNVHVNQKMIYRYLLSGEMHNIDDLSETFYEEIKQLKPGFYAILENFELKQNKYWNPEIYNHELDFDSCSQKFKSLFNDSLNRRLRSDVPIGTSLSGGLDSSFIACSINRIGTHNFSTFSAKFPGFKKDESSYIETVRNSIDSSNYDVFTDNNSIYDEFSKVLSFQDEPVLSPSIITQYKVFATSRKNGVKVLLDGQGADEILGGYTGYIDAYLIELISKRDYQSAISFLTSYLKWNRGNDINSNFSRILKLLFKIIFGADRMNVIQLRNIKNISKDNRINTFINDMSYGQDKFEKKNISLKETLKSDTLVGGMQDLLRFADRNSMANSIEVRLPFLSHHILEFLMCVPPEFFIREGKTKAILRSSAKGIVPKEIQQRKDKIGYEPPSFKWHSFHDYNLIKEENNLDFRLANLAQLKLNF